MPARTTRIITPDMPDDSLVSINEACLFLGICREILNRMANSGEVTRVTLNKTVVRFRVGSLRRVAGSTTAASE
ncbi:hypothetical protein D3C77_762020 [compost metagenome]